MGTAFLHRAARADRTDGWSQSSLHPPGRRAFLAIPLLIPLLTPLLIPMLIRPVPAAGVAASAGLRPVERGGWILDASDR
ncbi:MAG: hypothetical protein NTW53_01025 [Burkholderiales bacterium]|nr:hypothetical protein [Burkholderiales bacterium]